MARRQKIHSTINEHFIPEVGVFGDVWLAKAEQSFWYVTRDGSVVCLSDVLNNVPAHTPPRHGRDGKDGVGTKGERGATGNDGRDGAPGKDSTVPGPRGEVGPAGIGQPGPRGPAGPDSAQVLADARAEIAAIRSEFAALKLECQAIREANAHAAGYIDYLKAKVAASK